jgi:hypothetical protein
MASRALVLLLSISAFLAPGCSCDPVRTGPRRDTGPGGGTDGGGGSVHEQPIECADGLDNDADGYSDCSDSDCSATAGCVGVDAGPRPDVPLEGCASDSFDGENAVAPVDIVWVIDNSGSMGEEAMLVQENMNMFADRMVTSGIEDYHVVLLTQLGFVTIPDPLGSDTEHFLHVDVDVQSHDGFAQAVSWLMPGSPTGYGHFLRREAALHIVFITDDESDMDDAVFRSQLRSMLGRDFVGHAIASPIVSAPICFPIIGCMPGPGCTGPHGDAPSGGQQYIDLVMASAPRGVFQSICTDDWTTVFDALLEEIAIAAPLPCNFRIPEPPAGETFDRNLVNVVYTPTGAAEGVTFPRSDDCANPSGWYYDDATTPTEILLCPDACSAVSGDATGSVDIELGCETVIF